MVPPEVQEARKIIASYGGKKRSEKMTPDERISAARKAANARWQKNKQELSTQHSVDN